MKARSNVPRLSFRSSVNAFESAGRRTVWMHKHIAPCDVSASKFCCIALAFRSEAELKTLRAKGHSFWIRRVARVRPVTTWWGGRVRAGRLTSPVCRLSALALCVSAGLALCPVDLEPVPCGARPRVVFAALAEPGHHRVEMSLFTRFDNEQMPHSSLDYVPHA